MDVCTNPDVLKVIQFVFLIIDIVKIIIPIVLIIYGLIGFSKAVINSDEKEQKKNVQLFFKRILYAILIFAVPWIIEVLMITLGNLLGEPGTTNFTDCIENAKSECITAIDSNNINTIKEVCHVPKDFTIKSFCWKCASDVTIYEWDVIPSTTDCTEWKKTSLKKEQCPVSNEVCWQCNDNPNLYQWGESTKSDPNCHASWHQINLTKAQCMAKY